MLAASQSAQAFEIAHTDNGDMVRWHAAPVFDTARPEGVAALRAAARAWSEVMPPALQLRVRLAADDLSLDPHDGASAVVWLDDAWDDDLDARALAVTIRVHRRDNGALAEADIAINGAGYQWRLDDAGSCDQAFDLRAVLTHELGHAVGLNHNEELADSVMFPTIGACERKWALHGDDLDAIALLYAAAGPGDPTGSEIPDLYGCSVAGTGSAATSILVVIALVAVWARRRGALLCVLVVCGLAITDARASVVRGASMEELAASSGAVARGRVIAQRAVEIGGRVYTDTVVDVAGYWRGWAGDEIVVRQLGGIAGNRVVEVAGAPRLVVADEVVLFLRKRRDGAWTPVGMSLGVFVVERDRDGARAVRDARGLAIAGPDGQVTAGGLDDVPLHELERRVAGAN